MTGNWLLGMNGGYWRSQFDCPCEAAWFALAIDLWVKEGRVWW